MLALLPALCLAQVPLPKPNTYINDLANVLNDGQELLINKRLRMLEDKYSIQVAIVVLQDLPAGYDVERYALEVGRTWHVGKADNGLVYVVALGAHKQRLEVANRLQGTITDLNSGELLDELKPYLKSHDYTGGLLRMIDHVDQLVTPAKAEQQALGQASDEKKDEDHDDLWLVLYVTIGVVAWFGSWGYLRYQRRKRLKVEALRSARDREMANIHENYGGTYGGRGGGKTEAAKKYYAERERPSEAYVAPVYVTPTESPRYESPPSTPSYDPGPSTSFGDFGGGGSDSGFSGGGASGDF